MGAEAATLTLGTGGAILALESALSTLSGFGASMSSLIINYAIGHGGKFPPGNTGVY